jgi:F-type H+-transporting ATPase subunit epsilon
MENKLNFEITTPERVVYSDAVDEVILPTPQGEIGILPHHIPLVSLVSAGEIRIKKGGETIHMATSGGFVQIQPKKIVVLADTAEHAEEIDEARAEEARKKVQALLKEKRVDAAGFAALSAKIEKELARLKVAKRRRRKQPPAGPMSDISH